jgi:hypothetical protein
MAAKATAKRTKKTQEPQTPTSETATGEAEGKVYPDADKPIVWREHKPKTKREQERLERRVAKIYERGGQVGSETPRARYWKHYYLSLGISRSLSKVAERVADEKLMERDGYRLDPRSPKRNDQIWRQVKKLREGDGDWARWYKTAHHRCEIWSMHHGWQEAVDEHDREQMDVLRRETIQQEIAMRQRHLEAGQAVMLAGADDYLKVHDKGGVSPTAAIQAMGMGAQLERSALALGLTKGSLQPTTLQGLMAQLGQPADTGTGQTGASQADDGAQVTVTQVNNETTVTNTTVNTVNVIGQPLTVDVLRQLEAAGATQRLGWRQASGIAAASGGRAWLAQLPPPPPPAQDTSSATANSAASGSPATADPAAPTDIIEGDVREVPE